MALFLKIAPKQAWAIWGIAALFAQLDFFLQTNFGVMMPQLMGELHFSAEQVGWLAAMYFYINIAAQLPAGVAFDRYPSRFVLAQAALLCGLGCILFSVSHTFVLCLLGRVFMGYGGAFAFIGSTRLMRSWFPAQVFNKVFSGAEFVGMIIGMLSLIFMSALISAYGWRDLIFYLGLILCGLSFCYSIFIKEKVAQNKKTHAPQTLAGIVDVLKDTPFWANGLYCGIAFSIITTFSSVWGVPYTMALTGASLTQATTACTLILIGAGVGCPLMVKLQEYLRSYRPVLIASACCEIILFLLLLSASTASLYSVMLIYFLLGLGCSSYVLNFTLANHMAVDNNASTAVGLTNLMSLITAPILQPLIGYIISISAHSRQQSSVYIVSDYGSGLAIFIVLLLFAIGITFLIPEPEAQSQSGELNYSC